LDIVNQIISYLLPAQAYYWQSITLRAIGQYCSQLFRTSDCFSFFQSTSTYLNSIYFLILVLILLLAIHLRLLNRFQRMKNEKSSSQELYTALKQNLFSFETSEIIGEKYLDVSPGCERLTGYTVEEFLLDPFLLVHIIHPDDLPNYLEMINYKGNTLSRQIPIRIIHKNGSIRWVSHTGIISRTLQDGKQIYRAINLDINKQVGEQTNSKQISQLFEQFAHYIKEMVWIQERNPDRMLFVNKPFMDFFQYSPDRMKHKPYAYLDMIHPEDLDSVLEMLTQLKTLQNPVDLEYRVIRNNTERHWVTARIIPIMDERGNHYRDFGIAYDITNIKKIQTELAFANETLNQLANNIHEIFWIRDRFSKGFIFANALFEQTFAQPITAFHNNLALYYDFIYPDDRIWVQKAEENLFRNGKKFVGEYRLQLPDHNIRWVRTQAYPIYNTEGVFYQAAGIIEDVTEWKNNEQSFKEFAHQQNIIVNLQKKSLKHSDISQFLHDIVLAVNELFKVKYCTLLEFERNSNVFLLRAVVGLSTQLTIPNLFPSDNNYLPGYTMLNSDIVISENLEKENHFQLPEFFANLPIKSCISATITGAEAIYGVLTFYCDTVHSFSNAQINFIQSIAGLISEILLRYQTEKALKASENQYRELIELQNTGILILNADGRIRYVNPAAETLFDTPKDFLVGYDIETLLDTDNLHIYRKEHEKIYQGGETTFELLLSKTPDFPKDVMITAITRVNEKKEPVEIINIMRDITQQKREEDELVHLTLYDSLTGIFNRSYYENELFRLSVTDYYPISIIIGDVDDLKGTNDKYGHAMGDRLLIQVSTILKTAFRPGDVIARIGGDEFAILMTDTNYRMMKQMLERIQTKVKQANKQSDLPFSISISIGGATSFKKSTLRNAIQKADMRMYEQKKKKKADQLMQ
jgi:diguanylate cyclase (GGDEF)-like protein/PAS domain S-box-containing protein